jgi:hypothetical protein
MISENDVERTTTRTPRPPLVTGPARTPPDNAQTEPADPDDTKGAGIRNASAAIASARRGSHS